MAKLSDKRKTAIYSAVREPLMSARLKLKMRADETGRLHPEFVDRVVATAMDEACAAAVRAAEGARADS